MAEQCEMERQIREAGKHDTTVRHWLEIQRVNHLSWTETVEYIAMALLADKQDLFARLLHATQTSTQPIELNLPEQIQ